MSELSRTKERQIIEEVFAISSPLNWDHKVPAICWIWHISPERIGLNGEDHVSKLGLNGFNSEGRIPSFPSCLTRLSGLSELTSLCLRDNILTGEICLKISKLNKLEELDLSHNQLTGTMAVSFGDLTNLIYLNLSCMQSVHWANSIQPRLLVLPM